MESLTNHSVITQIMRVLHLCYVITAFLESVQYDKD